MTKIKHFRDKCIGCAYCVEIAPEFWKMNMEDGRCDLVGSARNRSWFELEIFQDEVERNRKVAAICPGKCIRIETK
ncbi:hypothetical protein BZG02_12035 [Labilibaculum filiforme]|uniref:4Fe-4S ferredoxin-type domain-containing protein n=1 Tax=Labilibaculum filiforme TaxID=1940526 RepID=A0A2N3HWM2_9BACT|nr:ferredoxin [Labilibaculum filiforme]PKQ62454.1 hypothetical protein BZG02_12035 [Labilibaculum filiforme]